MDIFTTQLTRVVPVPIKPANLKVKGLLKEARTGELKEDLDHLENHEYYFKKSPQEKQSKQNDAHTEQDEPAQDNADKMSENITSENKDQNKSNDKAGVTTSKDGVKHLDLYV